MQPQQTSYLSPKLEARLNSHLGEYGVFARQPVKAGELLAVWGGEIVTGQQVPLLPERVRKHSIQVEENLFLAPSRLPEAADYVNHSCNPNAGLSGQIALVAMRDIAAGEEVCFDYAMSDSNTYDEFDCACGAYNCRHRVSGDDWARPDLWVRYHGYFSPYLQRRIEKLRAASINSYPDRPAFVGQY